LVDIETEKKNGETKVLYFISLPSRPPASDRDQIGKVGGNDKDIQGAKFGVHQLISAGSAGS
jgi:hypothetical protein